MSRLKMDMSKKTTRAMSTKVYYLQTKPHHKPNFFSSLNWRWNLFSHTTATSLVEHARKTWKPRFWLLWFRVFPFSFFNKRSLSLCECSDGKLEPAFSSYILVYTLSVPENVTQIQFEIVVTLLATTYSTDSTRCSVCETACYHAYDWCKPLANSSLNS